MLRAAVLGLVLTSGCASLFGPLVASSEEPDSKGNASQSKFTRCGMGGFIVGGLIDGVVIASDLLISEEFSLLDGVIIVPFALDILIGASLQGGCYKG